MKIALPLFAVLCLMTLAGFCPAQSVVDSPASVKKKVAGVNAAPLYERAFSAMPKLDDAERKLLNDRPTLLSAACGILITKAEPALRLCAEASRGNFCDWNFDYQQGAMLSLPQPAKMQDLARLALLKASASNALTALEQYEMVLRMARHVGSTPLIICRLVGMSIEVLGIESIATMLPEWNGEQRNRLRRLVTTELDLPPSASDCTVFEAKNLSAWLRRLLDEEVKKNGTSFDGKAFFSKMTGETNVDAKLERLGLPLNTIPRDAAGVRNWLQDYENQSLGIARIVALPREAMSKEAANLETKLKADPWKLDSLKISKQLRERDLKLENMRTLLRAAFNVLEGGATVLPAELGTYRKTKGGFELTGRELFNGKPVVLVVGTNE